MLWPCDPLARWTESAIAYGREHIKAVWPEFSSKLDCFVVMHLPHGTPTHTHPHPHQGILPTCTYKHTQTHTHTHTHTSKVEKFSLGFVLLAKVFPWHVQEAPKLVGEKLKVGPSSFAQKAFDQMTVDKISST